ncbi:prolyl 4-hydroxylase subunit alpha-1-like [Mizuhopecten yessoensis]|uniref:prolyl 4-hydroxylase subunit alpha-1-like n=1 Tax=Mizuhopecten yessoensis TaxID=6573 RepID=UPI000B45760A|nr:prolyl 4-hydroxylase subunit alpha-1-like [Mizuhopecten yessoensis]
MDFKTLMSGTILNTSASPLTTADGISIAKYLEGEHKIAWTEALLELDDVTEKESLLYDLAVTYHVVGRSRKALAILKDLHQTGTRRVASMLNIVRQKAEKSEDKEPHEKPTSTVAEMDHTYRKLCRENIQSKNNLHCYNKVTRIPYYTGKEEVLSYVPRISRFHDVISDMEIMQVKYACKAHLSPANVIGRFGKVMPNYKTRTGETAWIEPSEKIAKKLENRVELLTGLDTFYREEMQTTEHFELVNYGLGGHYLNHYDSLDLNKIKTINRDYALGDRFATWMFYMSDVEAGGATVFPKLNLRILPVKGSAVFWYNLLPSGVRDERSMHGSCPVLLGSKWITTKWILEIGQEFRQPCKRNPLDEHF